jgi:hypothetical protein
VNKNRCQQAAIVEQYWIMNSINILFEIKYIHLRDRNRIITANPSFQKKINTGLAFNLFSLHMERKPADINIYLASLKWGKGKKRQRRHQN